MMQIDSPIFLRNVAPLDGLAVQLGHQLWQQRPNDCSDPPTQISIARELVTTSFKLSGKPLDDRLINGEAQRICELLRRYRKKGWYRMPPEFCRRPVSTLGPPPSDGIFTRSVETLNRMAVELGYQLWSLAESKSNDLPSQINVAKQVVRRSGRFRDHDAYDQQQIDIQAHRIADLLRTYRLRGWYRMPDQFRAR